MIDLKNRGLKQAAKNSRKGDKKKASMKDANHRRNGAQAKRNSRRQPSDSRVGQVVKGFVPWFVKGSLVGLGGLLVYGFAYFSLGLYTQASARPVNNIGIEGSFSYVSKGHVSALVSPFIEKGFLQVPISDIKLHLENDPWIETVLVSRRWPDTLYISVVEQQPIARWSDYGFVNYHGKVVNVGDNTFLSDLPLLQGSEEQSLKMMKDYQQVTQQLRPYKLSVRDFVCDELMSWRVVLSNGIEITLGRDEIMEKMRRFLLVYNTSLKSQVENIASIDLRYGNGVAVKWKLEATVDAKASRDGKQA